MLGRCILGKERAVSFESDVEIVPAWSNEKEQDNVKTQLIILSINNYRA